MFTANSDHQFMDDPSFPSSRGNVVLVRQGAHTYSPNTFHGGVVHLGDVYNVSNGASSRRLSTEWHARPAYGIDSADSDHLYIVPRTSTFQFTGRATENRLIGEYLRSPLSPSLSDRHKIVVLFGLGGSGKTQVCLRYAESVRDKYWGIFWIDVSSSDKAQAGYVYLAQQAGVGDLWTAGKYWLSECRRPWLLILDNADDPEIDLADYLPAGSRGHVLITTRLYDFRTYATAGRLKFDKMEPEEAIDLLLKAAYPDNHGERTNQDQRSLANNVAETLGYLAIALNQAGATVRRNIYTLERYLRFYLGMRKRLMLSHKIPPEELDIIATWEVPFKRIERNESSHYQDAVRLMHIFAFLHFEAIPEALFPALWSQNSLDSYPSPALPSLLRRTTTGLEDSEARLRRAIEVLSGHSIIEYDPGQRTCSLHPVVHDWVKSRINDDKKMAFWLRCTLHLLSCCTKMEVKRLSVPQRLDRRLRLNLLPHIDSCLDLAYQRAPHVLRTRDGVDQAEVFASYYEANGVWKKALKLLEEILAFHSRRFGSWSEDSLRVKRSIARCHWNLFQVEPALNVQLEIRRARWWKRPSLLDWRNPILPDHIQYCIALDDLTQTLWLAGARDMSKWTGRRAKEGLLRRLPSTDPRVLDAMFNLGRTLRHLGELDEAHKLLSFVVRHRKNREITSVTKFTQSDKTSGPNLDHPETLMARNELGMSLWARRQRLAAAERIVSNVLAARSRTLGRDHAYTLWSVNDLSKILCTRNRPNEAVHILEEIVPVVRETLGKEHVGMLMTKGNLARAYAFAGRWLDAEGALSDIIASIDEKHPDWFHSTYGYVRIQTQLGHFEKAEDGCQQLLKKTTSAEATSRHFRLTIELLGNVYYQSAQQEKLTALYEEYDWIDQQNIQKPPLFL